MKRPARAVTVEEFERMPESGMRTELIRGEVREMPPPKSIHGRITADIQYALKKFVMERRIGQVFGESGYLIERDPDTVRAPDCSFVRSERLPDPLPEAYLPFAPDLAVEVLSPGDRAGDVQEKVEAWLTAGCRMVWVIDPRKRHVVVHRPGRPAQAIAEGDTLDGDDVLPGFRVPVAELLDR